MFNVITIYGVNSDGACESSFKEPEEKEVLKRLNQHNSYGLVDDPICCNVQFL